MSKNAPISANLIAVKGAARTSAPVPAASNDVTAAVVEMPKIKPPKEPEQPLNFSVPATWKKRFAQAALNEDMKHKEFLFSLFAEYEKRIKGE